MNPFEQYLAVLAEAAPTAEKYLPDSAGKTVSGLQQRVEDNRIRIMLFGAYNAGKSTLLNALVGEEAARVGDIPTTDQVDKYDWEGHVLLDTPGVNAPIEHQQVSEAELERTDLVLFVMRQEDQDSKDSIERLFKLLKAGRPLFLLLNYEDSDELVVRQIREKLSKTLADSSDRYGYDLDALAQVPVMPLNAKVALKARLDCKEKLREISGYDDFILRFTDWLRQYDERTKRLELVRDRVQRELLTPVRQAIVSKLPDGESDGDTLSQQISHFQREEGILRDASHNKARTEINLHRPELSAALDGDASEQAVIAAVTRVAEDVAQATSTWLDREIELSIEKSLRASLRTGGVDIPDVRNSRASSSFLLDTATETALSGIKKGATPENVKRLLLLGRKLKIPGLKGRWEKTFGKWAGKAGPVIQVAIGAVEVGLAHRAQEIANGQALNAAMQRNQWVEGVCTDMLSSLTQNIDSYLRSSFEALLEPLNQEKEALLGAAKEVERDLLAWDEFVERVQAARF